MSMAARASPTPEIEGGRCRGYAGGMDGRGDRRGSAWQAAIDFGIDVSLLEENLALTPEERLEQLVAMQRFYDVVRAERAQASKDAR